MAPEVNQKRIEPLARRPSDRPRSAAASAEAQAGASGADAGGTVIERILQSFDACADDAEVVRVAVFGYIVPVS